jgi:hypothetical protein
MRTQMSGHWSDTEMPEDAIKSVQPFASKQLSTIDQYGYRPIVDQTHLHHSLKDTRLCLHTK